MTCVHGCADIYTDRHWEEKRPEFEQTLARDRFQVFAGFQGATLSDAHLSVEASMRHAE